MIPDLLKENGNENRIALLPKGVKTLISLKVKVLIEHNAGGSALVVNKVAPQKN